MRAPFSRKYVSEKGIAMSNWSKTFQTFWSHSFVFPLENNLKIEISRFLLPLKDNLLDTFNKSRTPTSGIHVSEQDIVMPNWSKSFQQFWSHSTVFNLQRLSKNLNFHSCFTFNRPTVGYSQRNVCRYFQKICRWPRYSDVKLIKSNSNFLVRLVRFSFRKTT